MFSGDKASVTKEINQKEEEMRSRKQEIQQKQVMEKNPRSREKPFILRQKHGVFYEEDGWKNLGWVEY